MKPLTGKREREQGGGRNAKARSDENVKGEKFIQTKKADVALGRLRKVWEGKKVDKSLCTTEMEVPELKRGCPSEKGGKALVLGGQEKKIEKYRRSAPVKSERKRGIPNRKRYECEPVKGKQGGGRRKKVAKKWEVAIESFEEFESGELKKRRSSGGKKKRSNKINYWLPNKVEEKRTAKETSSEEVAC